MDTKYMVLLQGNVIETTITYKASVVGEWIQDVKSTAHIYQNIAGIDCMEKDGQTVILQLCVGTKCLLFQTLHSDHNNVDRFYFLLEPSFIFAGVDVKSKFPTISFNYADIEALAAARWCWPMQITYPRLIWLASGYSWKPGLKVIARSVANLNIERPNHVMLSNWTDKELSVEQIEFACIDVYACFRIGCELLKHGNAMPSIMKSPDSDDD